MAVTRPCIVGKMGSTTFYETTMTARELANSVRAAREADDWGTQGIEDRIQREVNESRVKKTIVPYLGEHQDRFFGSFIVLAEKGSVSFEPFSKVAGDLPKAYENATENIGFLTIDRGELIALDGQHRLVAFREVITGGAGHMKFASQVGDDEVCVIFIEFEDKQKTRRIFNKVNRNAKPTGKTDNIITSEDDGFAIVTRWLTDPERDAPLAERELPDDKTQALLDWKNSSLSAKSQCITTLTTVYETVKSVLTYFGVEGFSEESNPVAPSDDALEAGYEIAAQWWEELLLLDAFQDALEDPEGIPDIRFAHNDKRTLILRPVGQQVLVLGMVLSLQRSQNELTLATLLERVGKVDWSADPSSMWRDVIVRPDGRMINKKENQVLGARLVAHLIAHDFESAEDEETLRCDWNEFRGKDPFTPIDKVEEGKLPEDLPNPVS